jgi:hypothetical protein
LLIPDALSRLLLPLEPLPELLPLLLPVSLLRFFVVSLPVPLVRSVPGMCCSRLPSAWSRFGF